MIEDPEEEIEDWDGEDFEDEWEFDCHMGSDGQCGAAGSEDCDFECPIMADVRARAKRKAKK